MFLILFKCSVDQQNTQYSAIMNTCAMCCIWMIHVQYVQGRISTSDIVSQMLPDTLFLKLVKHLFSTMFYSSVGHFSHVSFHMLQLLLYWSSFSSFAVWLPTDYIFEPLFILCRWPSVFLYPFPVPVPVFLVPSFVV